MEHDHGRRQKIFQEEAHLLKLLFEFLELGKAQIFAGLNGQNKRISFSRRGQLPPLPPLPTPMNMIGTPLEHIITLNSNSHVYFLNYIEDVLSPQWNANLRPETFFVKNVHYTFIILQFSSFKKNVVKVYLQLRGAFNKFVSFWVK